MKIVVLSDKRPGHYKQSSGIVQNLTEYNIEWQDIRFRQKWRDNLLRIFICIFGGFSLPTPFIKSLLEWSLHSTDYNSLLIKDNVDIVLSTGSSLAAINLLLGKLYQAKTITCRRPSPIGVRNFDLAILPMLSCYKDKKQKNVCKTIGVPNPISPEVLNDNRDDYAINLNLDRRKCIGILIGGADKSENITIEDVIQLYETIDSAVRQLNLQILLTTSRRTPPEVTDYLKLKLEITDWCSLFIEPNSASIIDDPYEAILALSDLIIVTGDSFSMVCEAASSGRRVIVLPMTLKAIREPRRYKVYRYMEENMMITLSNRNELSRHIKEEFHSDTSNKTLQDTEIAVREIRKLLKSNKELMQQIDTHNSK